MSEEWRVKNPMAMASCCLFYKPIWFFTLCSSLFTCKCAALFISMQTLLPLHFMVRKTPFSDCKTPFSDCKTPFSDRENAVFWLGKNVVLWPLFKSFASGLLVVKVARHAPNYNLFELTEVDITLIKIKKSCKTSVTVTVCWQHTGYQ